LSICFAFMGYDQSWSKGSQVLPLLANIGRGRKNPVLNGMNIESKIASLMPVARQDMRPPQLAVPERAPLAPERAREPAPVSAPAPTGPSAQSQAEEARDNRRRMAIAEKLVGANKSLIIEKDTNRVGFVYKTIDKSTGEVVRVWPQREVATALLALSDPDARAAMFGMMVDAKA
jgi:uncharacterized FlaG/YvyC family protein